LLKSFSSTAAIIIPTKDRLKWLLKVIYYYDQLQFKGSLVLVDSSEQSNEKAILRIKNDLNLIYIYAPSKSVHQAVMLGVRNLPSYIEFIIQTGDDDYICTDMLGKLIDFLRSNPDYNAVYGNAFSIGIEQRSLDISHIRWCRKYWKGFSVIDINPIGRVEKILQNYTNLEFALRRKNSVLTGLEVMNKTFGKLEFSESTTLEVAAVIDTAIAGKIHYIDCNYLIRGDHGGRPNRSHKSLIEQYLTSDRFTQLKSYLNNRITKNIKPETEFIGLESNRIILEYIESSIRGRILKPYERNNFVSILKKIILNFQDKLNRLKIRKYLRIITL
jgi:glycosyltransferase domain-containing protein